MESLTYRERVRGSLLAGAVGDALGAGIEFDAVAAIRAAHGEAGVTGFTPAYGQVAPITDDTQMTLFTAEGLIRAGVAADSGAGDDNPASVIWRAYLRWLSTQTRAGSDGGGTEPGWLVTQPALHSRRSPGNACISGLSSGRMGTRERPANPGSKGCGAVMRSAPFGWLPWDDARIWDLAIDCAVLTHGHPSGYYSAAAFALIIRHLIIGETLQVAVEHAIRRLRDEGPVADESRLALEAAVALFREGEPTPERVEQLGGGWVAEEALAIAVYCALAAPDVESALLAAVNHSGDSDSTGAITGNIVGAAQGDAALPPRWLAEVEARELLAQVADDFVDQFTEGDRWRGDGPRTDWTDRYPGS
jgi:ADP-ribosylglycohydrolase